jgi:hypothetical protein
VPWSGSVGSMSGSTAPVSICSACWRRPRPSLQADPGDQFLRLRARGPRAVLPRFRAQGHGVLINNASVYSYVGAPWLTAYVSSKFAVRGFSEAFRQELGDLPDVHVCTVSPSPIDSPIFASAASYSGRAVKAPPPTYPPEQVASAILASALHPKRERIVGGPGRRSRWPKRLPRAGSSKSTAAIQPVAVRRRASPRHRRQPVRTRLRRPRRGPRRLAAPARPATSAPPVGRGRTAGRRLNHHRSDCHPLGPDLTGPGCWTAPQQPGSVGRRGGNRGPRQDELGGPRWPRWRASQRSGRG